MEFETPRGWQHLVDGVKEEGAKRGFTIYDIKEVFGGLRLYLMHLEGKVDLEMEEEIQRVEDISYKTCRECGGYVDHVKNIGGKLRAICISCL